MYITSSRITLQTNIVMDANHKKYNRRNQANDINVAYTLFIKFDTATIKFNKSSICNQVISASDAE